MNLPIEYNIDFFKKIYKVKKYTVEYEGKISLEYIEQELKILYDILVKNIDISLTYTKNQIEYNEINDNEELLIKITGYTDGRGDQVYNDSNIAMIDEIILNYLKEKITENKKWESIFPNIKADNIYNGEIKVHYYGDDLIFTGWMKNRSTYNQLSTKQKTALQVYELRYIIQMYLPNAKKGTEVITQYNVPNQSCKLTNSEVEIMDYGQYGVALRKIMDYLVKQLNKKNSMEKILSDRNFVKQIVIHTEYKKHNKKINQIYSNIFGDNHTTDVANKKRRKEYVVPILDELKRLFIDNKKLSEYTPSGYYDSIVMGARIGVDFGKAALSTIFGGNKTRKQKRNGKKVKNTRKKKYKKKRTRRVRKK